MKLGFAWHSLEQSNAKLVFGSGWPSTVSPDPIRGIYTAVTHQTIEGAPKEGWAPAQRLSVEDALRAWTVNGAYATFASRSRGKLRVGMNADIVVLSQDLFEIPPSQIWKTRV